MAHSLQQKILYLIFNMVSRTNQVGGGGFANPSGGTGSFGGNKQG